LHYVQAIGVERGKAEELADALDEHANYRERNPSHFLLDRPAVYQHTYGDHEAESGQAGVQPVFGNAVAAFLDVAFYDVLKFVEYSQYKFSSPLYIDFTYVSPTAAEESSDEIPSSWSDVEETALKRRSKAEARVEDVADGCQKRVHIPHHRAAREACDEYVGIAEQYKDTPWIDPGPQLLGLLFAIQACELVTSFAVDCFRN
jgi:hypothetical protein